ncbi:MAG TPA: hypothetical protein VF574_15995 [Allosphingosinicella sp.]
MKWPLLKRVEAYLKRSRMRPTRFGLEVTGDPQLVFQLRRGRKPRPPLEAKINAYLERMKGEAAAMPVRRRS